MDTDIHRILSPVTRGNFFSDYWEKQLLHVARQNDKYFADLISIRDIDKLLSETNQTFPDLQLVDAHNSVKVADYKGSDQQIDIAALRKLYLEGATVILSAAHLKLPALAGLCRSVTGFFERRSQANMYLSPAGQQGFNPHFDTHDVFILQISGSKTFRFYQSDIELPFTDDTFDPALCEHAELQEEVTINAGGTLYIPRGVVHDAVAAGNAPSLHITLGVFAISHRDLLQEVVLVAGERDVRLRQSIIQGCHPTSDELIAMFSESINDELIREARSRLLDEVALGDLSTAADVLSAGLLQLDTEVCVDSNNLINIETHGDSVKVRLHGQILEFDGAFASAVQEILGQPGFVVGEVTGLDETQCITLCNQLFCSGLIRIKAADS